MTFGNICQMNKDCRIDFCDCYKGCNCEDRQQTMEMKQTLKKTYADYSTEDKEFKVAKNLSLKIAQVGP